MRHDFSCEVPDESENESFSDEVKAVPCPACGRLKMPSAAYCLFCGYSTMPEDAHASRARSSTNEHLVSDKDADGVPRLVFVTHSGLSRSRRVCVETRGLVYTATCTLMAVGILLLVISAIWHAPNENSLPVLGIIMLGAGLAGTIWCRNRVV